MKWCIPENNLFGPHDHTNEFIDSFRLCVGTISLYSYLWYPIFLLLLSPNFHFFPIITNCKWLTFEQLLDFTTCWLYQYIQSIHHFVSCCWIITTEVMHPCFFLTNPFYLSRLEARVCFFRRKASWANYVYWLIFFFCSLLCITFLNYSFWGWWYTSFKYKKNDIRLYLGSYTHSTP